MRFVVSAVMVVMMAGSYAFAEEAKTQATPAENALSTITGKGKKGEKEKSRNVRRVR